MRFEFVPGPVFRHLMLAAAVLRDAAVCVPADAPRDEVMTLG